MYRLPEDGGALLKHVHMLVLYMNTSNHINFFFMESYYLFFIQSKPHKLCQHTAALLYVTVCYTHGKGKDKFAHVHDMKAYRWSRCGVAHNFTLAVKGSE